MQRNALSSVVIQIPEVICVSANRKEEKDISLWSSTCYCSFLQRSYNLPVLYPYNRNENTLLFHQNSFHIIFEYRSFTLSNYTVLGMNRIPGITKKHHNSFSLGFDTIDQYKMANNCEVKGKSCIWTFLQKNTNWERLWSGGGGVWWWRGGLKHSKSNKHHYLCLMHFLNKESSCGLLYG